jgi:hypothetical protein
MVMPSAQLYGRFLDALRKNVWVFDAAEYDEQRLDAALAILQGVVLLLQKDEEIADARLARPLGWLESAVNDLRRGANVTALRPADPISGRPTGLARERVQGTLAFCVELLIIAAKVPAAEAADFIANKARKLLVSERGDQITAAQVAGWRRELNRGGATAGGREFFRQLRQEYGEFFKVPSALERNRCEALASGLIEGASVVSPRSAPNRRRSDPKTQKNSR